MSRRKEADDMQAMRYEDMPSQLPRRGNAFSRWLGRCLLGLLGWRLTGAFPPVPKFILLGAPHTSNFDVLPALGGVLKYSICLSVMVKDTAFRGPWAGLLRWLGAVPIDRRQAGGVVAATVRAFKESEALVLVIMGEGTRKAPEQWKTGWYHIALQAGIPLVPSVLRYDRKVLEFKAPFYPSGDFERDWPLLLAQFRDGCPRYAERLSRPMAELQGKVWQGRTKPQ